MLASAVPFGPTLTARTYSSPTTLALTNDRTINTLLAEIPFFSVGILAFAVFTFLFIIRRLDSVSGYIAGSALLGFVAAILDLSNLINTTVSQTPQQSTNYQASASLIVAREILFSLSVGLRFLFFWAFVAERPRGEGPSPSPNEGQRPNFIHMNSDVTLHSGSWYRWGIVGMILKWGLLGVSITIPILQMIWRIVTAQSTFGPVYDADGTMEIVGSALFALKLLLNAWLAPDATRWRVLCHYLIVIAALGINLAIGAADLLCFAFSETVLGRFLQAIEIYILILYLLVSSFLHQRQRPPSYSTTKINPPVRPISGFRGLPTIDGINPRGSTFHVSPPVVSTPTTSVIIVEDARAGRAEGPRPLMSRLSTASRVSSWLMSRGRFSLSKPRVPSGRDQEQLWDGDNTEKGYIPNPSPTPTALRASAWSPDGDESFMGPKQSAKWLDPVYSSVMQGDSGPMIAAEVEQRMPDNDSVDPVAMATPNIARTEDTSRGDTTIDIETEIERAFSPRPSLATMPSYYAPPSERRSPSPRNLPPAPSPIYGLTGNVLDQDALAPSFSFIPQSSIESQRSSGVSALLRQQQELDKSIAQLRLFSPRSTMQSSQVEITERVGIDSASLRSEFSLSNFPEPPWQGQEEDSSMAETPRARPVNIVDDVPIELEPPKMPAAMEHRRQISLPSTMRGNSIDSTNLMTGARPTKFDSQGTQYDVTSFIGNLTTPERGASPSPFSSNGLSGVSSKTSDPDTTDATVTSLRKRSSSLQTVKPIIITPRSADADTGISHLEDETSDALSPRDATFVMVDPTLPRGPPASMFTPAGVVVEGKRRKGVVGLPPRPRLLISEPRMRNSGNGQNSFSPGAFEDPRPVPTFTDSR